LTIIEEELSEPLQTGEAARLRAVNAALAADTLRLQRELDGLRAEAEALRASTSWRVTAPIRTLVDLVRRLRRR
jgi:hypothetical protein